MKPRVALVGAGLAGSMLASRLAGRFDLTIVELADTSVPLTIPLRDEGQPARLWPHVGSGPGGTSQYWNNGLIEIEDDDFAAWPIARQDLDPYYTPAHILLSGLSRDPVAQAHDALASRYVERGIPAHLLRKSLFYPRRRRNAWRSLDLSQRALRFVKGRALHFNIADGGRAKSLTVRTAAGTEHIEADIFVLCGGGLSSPVLMQATARQCGLAQLAAAGRHYHDHPSGPVAEVTLNAKLYDLWDHSQPHLNGNIWMPFVVESDGLKFAFYLRPAVRLWRQRRREKLRSVLIDLRNAPYDPSLYWRLARNSDDMIEILSFKLGWHVPTRSFTVWIVAEQLPSADLAITASPDEDGIDRRWVLDDAYRAVIRRAFDRLTAALGPQLAAAHFFPEAVDELATGAHHSGTCRMAKSPNDGICDGDLKVYGTDNLFVCDGSVVPKAGYANTGLTIAALALRLADTIRDRF